MEHICIQEDLVRIIERRIDKLEDRVESNKLLIEKDVTNVTQLISEVKAFQNKLIWWMISVFGTSILTLLTLILKK